jgi:hypothetical protein
VREWISRVDAPPSSAALDRGANSQPDRSYGLPRSIAESGRGKLANRH